MAQNALVTNITPEGAALRAHFSRLLGAYPSLNRGLSVRLAGLDIAYPDLGTYPQVSAAHPLVGRHVPDLELEDAAAPSVFGLLRTARFVLLDLTGGVGVGPATWGQANWLEVATGRLAAAAWEAQPQWAQDQVRAVLIRPDGHVAWATSETDPAAAVSAAEQALRGWVGFDD